MRALEFEPLPDVKLKISLNTHPLAPSSDHPEATVHRGFRRPLPQTQVPVDDLDL